MTTSSAAPVKWRPEPTVGDRLRLLRRDYGLITGTHYGQREFAKLLKVPFGTYGSWEAGYAQPPGPIFDRIAEITGVDADWLAGVDPPKPPKSSNRRGPAPTYGSVRSGLWYPGHPSEPGTLWNPAHPYTERVDHRPDTSSPAFPEKIAAFLLSAA